MLFESSWEGEALLGNRRLHIAGLDYLEPLVVFRLSLELLMVDRESGGIGSLLQPPGGPAPPGQLNAIRTMPPEAAAQQPE